MGFFGKVFGDKKPDTPIPQAAPMKGCSASFSVMDVYNIMGVGIVVVGTVQGGTVTLGQRAAINGKQAEIKSIEANHRQIASAPAGQNVGISLKGIGKDDVRRGDILEFG